MVLRQKKSWIDPKRKLTHWHEEIDNPVKVMVVGIARFAVQYVGKVDDIPVESWVYPQNRDDGFRDYAVALERIELFPWSYRAVSLQEIGQRAVQNKVWWNGKCQCDLLCRKSDQWKRGTRAHHRS